MLKPVPAPEDAEVERAVAEAIARGDRNHALDLVMNEYGTAIFRLCLSLLRGDRQLAEELQQAVFVDAYQSLTTFAGRSSLRTWLMGIAAHRCRRQFRRQRVEERHRAAVTHLELVRRETGSAEERLISADSAEHLRRCLSRLDTEDRALVYLRCQERRPYEELSQILGKRVKALQMRVQRALVGLRRCIEECGGGP